MNEQIMNRREKLMDRWIGVMERARTSKECPTPDSTLECLDCEGPTCPMCSGAGLVTEGQVHKMLERGGTRGIPETVATFKTLN